MITLNKTVQSKQFTSKEVNRLNSEGTFWVQQNAAGTKTKVDSIHHFLKLYFGKIDITKRTRGGYTASHCRPDLSFGCYYASQHTIPDQYHREEHRHRRPKTLTCSSKLDSLFVATFIYASFWNNLDCTSHVGYVVRFMDQNCSSEYHSLFINKIQESGTKLLKSRIVCYDCWIRQCVCDSQIFKWNTHSRTAYEALYGFPVPLRRTHHSQSDEWETIAHLFKHAAPVIQRKRFYWGIVDSREGESSW